MSVSIYAALMASGCRCRAGGQALARVGLGRTPRVNASRISRMLSLVHWEGIPISG